MLYHDDEIPHSSGVSDDPVNKISILNCILTLIGIYLYVIADPSIDGRIFVYIHVSYELMVTILKIIFVFQLIHHKNCQSLLIFSC